MPIYDCLSLGLTELNRDQKIGKFTNVSAITRIYFVLFVTTQNKYDRLNKLNLKICTMALKSKILKNLNLGK